MSVKSVGALGEDDAVQFLTSQGYRIIARNVRPLPGMARGELDIVAWDGAVLCFIEVKTRRSIRSEAAENVTAAKQRQLISLAEAWLGACERPDIAEAPVRFDVVCVYADASVGGTRLILIRDAFRPE